LLLVGPKVLAQRLQLTPAFEQLSFMRMDHGQAITRVRIGGIADQDLLVLQREAGPVGLRGSGGAQEQRECDGKSDDPHHDPLTTGLGIGD